MSNFQNMLQLRQSFVPTDDLFGRGLELPALVFALTVNVIPDTRLECVARRGTTSGWWYPAGRAHCPIPFLRRSLSVVLISECLDSMSYLCLD
jgi:hypothetical protein